MVIRVEVNGGLSYISSVSALVSRQCNVFHAKVCMDDFEIIYFLTG